MLIITISTIPYLTQVLQVNYLQALTRDKASGVRARGPQDCISHPSIILIWREFLLQILHVQTRLNQFRGVIEDSNMHPISNFNVTVNINIDSAYVHTWRSALMKSPVSEGSIVPSLSSSSCWWRERMASSPVLSSTEVQSIWYCLSYSSLLAKQKIRMSRMIGDMQSGQYGSHVLPVLDILGSHH